MHYKVIKKNLKKFFYSKVFFSMILFAIIGSALLVCFKYIKHKNDSIVFSQYYNLLERYQGIQKSDSLVPAEELIKDIINEKSKLSFFSSFKNHYIFFEIATYVNLLQYKEALNLIDKQISLSKNQKDNSLLFLYMILKATIMSTAQEENIQHRGIELFEKLMAMNQFHDAVLFYYGFFLRNFFSLKKADVIFDTFKKDPQLRKSPYFNLIEKARNLDI